MIGFEPMPAGYLCCYIAPNPRGLTAWLHLDEGGILQCKRIVPRKKRMFRTSPETVPILLAGAGFAQGRPLAEVEGFEPPRRLNTGLSVFKTDLFDLLSTLPNGSSNRARTCDNLINSQVLYRLSYRGILGSTAGLEPACIFQQKLS